MQIAGDYCVHFPDRRYLYVMIFEELYSEAGTKGFSLYPGAENSNGQGGDFKDFYRKLAVIPCQTHSSNVAVVDSPAEMSLDDTDGIVTFERDLCIGVVTADCVPVLLHAPDVGGIAAVHAGWKGTLSGVVERGLEMLMERGADPALTRVAFGPSVSPDAYEVDCELARRFEDAGFGRFVNRTKWEKPHVDLQRVNMTRLLRKGVRMENVRLHSGCTVLTRSSEGGWLYQSHRRSCGAPGRMLTAIVQSTRK